MVWCGLVWFGMDDFDLVWLSLVRYGLVWFGMDEFGVVWLSLSLVRCGLFLFGLEDDLNENAIVETWIKIIKVTLDNRENSGSAIQFSLQTCLKLPLYNPTLHNVRSRKFEKRTFTYRPT